MVVFFINNYVRHAHSLRLIEDVDLRWIYERLMQIAARRVTCGGAVSRWQIVWIRGTKAGIHNAYNLPNENIACCPYLHNSGGGGERFMRPGFPPTHLVCVCVCVC